METSNQPAAGTGPMTDYWYGENHPWHGYRDSIVEVIIEDGVTTIGECAFYQCENIAGVTIPDTVTSIGEQAFYYSDLEKITFLGNAPAMAADIFEEDTAQSSSMI